MTAKVLKLELATVPTTDSTGNPINDPIATRINKIYADASMSGYGLVAAYETPTHLMLYFQKP